MTSWNSALGSELEETLKEKILETLAGEWPLFVLLHSNLWSRSIILRPFSALNKDTPTKSNLRSIEGDFCRNLTKSKTFVGCKVAGHNILSCIHSETVFAVRVWSPSSILNNINDDNFLLLFILTCLSLVTSPCKTISYIVSDWPSQNKDVWAFPFASSSFMKIIFQWQ
jgi:hypothetical protein